MRKHQLNFSRATQCIFGKIIPLCLSFFLFTFFSWSPVHAESQSTDVLGIHILNVNEIKQFRQVFTDDDWRYVTIPFTLADLQRPSEWQAFFDSAAEEKVIPILRLSTAYDSETDAWKVPTRKDIVEMATFLGRLDWHRDEKLVIVFNEVNHAKEWGGQLDPAAYAETLRFTSNWFHNVESGFKVLPAGLDLAASNSTETMEAFRYLDKMQQADPEIFASVDYWNSHSYPNPGFQASPKRTAQNSLRGYQYELAYLKKKTKKDYQVFITETGWVADKSTDYYLDDYYVYALKNIWNDERIVAVTPFVMKGSPGPFAGFSFFDAQDQATPQFFALQKALAALKS